ncbi:TPA: hypothetical protein R9Y26_006279 [Bacillus cereus]|nr:hypothetical protein [Bacillus cereus]
MGIGSKQSLLIFGVLCTQKRRNLIQDFVSVYIGPESFQSLLWYEKRAGYIEIQTI